MSLRPQSAALFLLAAVTLACDGQHVQSSTPSSPSGVISPSASIASPATLASRHDNVGQVIKMFDACDPQTFNAAIGPGTCVRNGGIRFDTFLQLLEDHHSVGAWHFTPPQGALAEGQDLVATNHGGETHTFTEVEEFGGGINSTLNKLTGLNTVAPECNQLAKGDFIPPGGSFRETEEESGVEKYQCCIHPWMRTEIRVTER